MIEKQRLEELIKQGAIIYHHIAKNYEEINVNDISQYTLDNWELYKEYYFETKEDAEWELETTATRTETLKLPKWKEFEEILEEAKLEGLLWKKCKIGLGVRNSQIVVFDNYGSVVKYFGTPNEENYIEACKLCLRLFRGEEVC